MSECASCGYDTTGFWGCACTMTVAQARVDRRMTWRVRAEHEADGRTYLLDGEYATREEAQRVADSMYGGFDDVDYWVEEVGR